MKNRKRIWIWIALLAAALCCGLFSAHGTDAAELRPAQVLLIDASGGTVRAVTDQGTAGLGATLDEALADLQAGADGAVFFGTVGHVVVSRRAAWLVPALAVARELRPSARLYTAAELPEASEAAAFLRAHPGESTLQAVHAALLYGQQPEVPLLLQTEGGLRLAG